MSRQLSHFLGTDENRTAQALSRLEELSGYTSEDNRLLSELRLKLHRALAELGLDAKDTTPKELYHSLLVHMDKSSHQFDRLVKANRSNGQAWFLNLIRLLELADTQNEVWVLKRSVAKELLRSQPPKKVMKSLKYRSVDSMLKREEVDELYLAAARLESLAWQKNFARAHSRLAAGDFEARSVVIVKMEARKWHINPTTAVSFAPTLGAIAFWPTPDHHESLHLGSFIALHLAIETLRLNSFSLLAKQARADFGREVAKQLEYGLDDLADIGGLKLTWQAVHHYWGSLPKNLYPTLSDPYLQSISTQKDSALAKLANLHPTFRWWQQVEHLAMPVYLRPVSFNIMDVAHNLVNKAPYSRRASHHMQLALWDELLGRYLKHPGVEQYVLKQMAQKLNHRQPQLDPEFYVADVEKDFQFA